MFNEHYNRTFFTTLFKLNIGKVVFLFRKRYISQLNITAPRTQICKEGRLGDRFHAKPFWDTSRLRLGPVRSLSGTGGGPSRHRSLLELIMFDLPSA